MGNIIKLNNIIIGDVAKRRWAVMRRLLPILMEYLNEAMRLEWRPGVVRSATVRKGGEVAPVPELRDSTSPEPGEFAVQKLLEDHSDTVDEILLLSAEELVRLLEWCEFLSVRDGAFELFAPLCAAVRARFVITRASGS